MNVTLEDISPCKKRVKIEIPANRVQQTFDKVAADYQKEARIPGFRPGHAPKNLVTKKYQKDIEEETQRTLMPEALRQVLEQHKLITVASPSLEDKHFVAGVSFSFSAVIEVAPQVTVPPYKGLKIIKQSSELDESEVDKALERLADNYATYNDITDRPAELGDYLVLTYTGSHDGTPIAQILPGAELLAHAESYWLYTKDTNFLPGFVDKCIGMSVGEAKSLDLEIPADFAVKEVAGKTLKYEVKLEGLKTKTSVILDDAFATKLGATSIDFLRNSARDVLVKRKEDEVRNAVRRQVIEHLLADSNFPIPESLLEMETDNAIRSLVEENQKHGVKPETLESQRAELYAAADRDAQQFVRFNFIAEEIAKRENISPSKEMLYEQLKQYAKSTNQPVEKVYKGFVKNGYPDELVKQLVRALVVEFIIREAIFVDPAPAEAPVAPAAAPTPEPAPAVTETSAPVEEAKEITPAA